MLFLALGIAAFALVISYIVTVLNLRAPDEDFGVTLLRGIFGGFTRGR